MIDPEIPDDARELVEEAFCEDVEIFVALDATMGADAAQHDPQEFASRIMEVVALEDLFDQE